MPGLPCCQPLSSQPFSLEPMVAPVPPCKPPPCAVIFSLTEPLRTFQVSHKLPPPPSSAFSAITSLSITCPHLSLNLCPHLSQPLPPPLSQPPATTSLFCFLCNHLTYAARPGIPCYHPTTLQPSPWEQAFNIGTMNTCVHTIQIILDQGWPITHVFAMFVAFPIVALAPAQKLRCMTRLCVDSASCSALTTSTPQSWPSPPHIHHSLALPPKAGGKEANPPTISTAFYTSHATTTTIDFISRVPLPHPPIQGRRHGGYSACLLWCPK
ncbi:hypothetical protein DUNSADRAFT_4350 [Dunaliella salina]|uniref:Encoded protein n=1 Tax=Dunaliella salina TaxID=3046 RepID=A0ABQ7H7R6_DUNSA|nr:hypothetical protein DUNSADRAFT_4350 [Dunaliella salina]|eukprot:KAF5842892.1 hypothetical protein DUNSADRAFT_4350 [Dunaliella salina]